MVVRKNESEYEIWESGKKIEIREKNSRYKIDLNKRLFNFTVSCLKLLNDLPNKKQYDIFKIQLSKSCTSIGANYEESQASSFAEFRQRIQICLREARETHYWLKVIKDVIDFRESVITNRVDRLIQESMEIKCIFGAISSKVKKS
jgi:four helix bundle protein